MKCAIKNCNRIVKYKTPKLLCKLHYHRWWRTGSFNLKKWYKPTINKAGYFRTTINGKRILLHRWILEQKIGRSFKKYERTHHKNGIKTDNRIENLEIVTQSKHMSKYHPNIWKDRKENNKSVNWTKIDIFSPASRWHPHPKSKCLVPKCNIDSITRGLCSKHYRSYCRYVKRVNSSYFLLTDKLVYHIYHSFLLFFYHKSLSIHEDL